MPETIGEIQRAIETALDSLAAQSASLPVELQGLRYLVPPEGHRPRVLLERRNPDGKLRKIRQDASAANWGTHKGVVVLGYEPAEPMNRAEAARSDPPAGEASEASPVEDLVRALARLESERRFNFISLKWFRDNRLNMFPWGQDAAVRQNVIRTVIEQRLVLTSKVPNPKSPEFPVTAIQLNRQHPEVSRILESPAQDFHDFRPVPIRGEPLSKTILADRR